MKPRTLILVRHAKSDWTHEVEDFLRPLNERGHENARTMAKYLLEKGIPIDQFLSSPAKRALTTCRYFAETYSQPSIKKVEDLYEPLLEDFYSTIEKADDRHESLALFSHNPTISEFGYKLDPETPEFPTCGVAIFEVETLLWSEFSSAPIKLKHFFTPKGI